MAEKQFFVTEEGLAALEKELEYLKTVRRREVAEKIKVALSFGDLSENSEYDEAKNDQAIMEARIADVEVMLKNAVVIDESELSNETVHIGSKIEVAVVTATGKKATKEYKIVGSNEADGGGNAGRLLHLYGGNDFLSRKQERKCREWQNRTPRRRRQRAART